MIEVIKIGGNIIDNDTALAQFLHDFALIKNPKILIHGGGKLATRLSEKLEIPTQMIDGRRVTDAETIKVVTMVYAGWINKSIVAALQAQGCNAIGLSGVDANVIPATRRSPIPLDYGFVGDVTSNQINVDFLHSLLQQNITPVFSAITHDSKGSLLNSNADGVASALAVALSANNDVQLTYCFEKKGVLFNPNDDNSVIQSITKRAYAELKQMGVITDGMIPKIDNAFKAIAAGVKQVVIKHAVDITNSNSGTTIS